MYGVRITVSAIHTTYVRARMHNYQVRGSAFDNYGDQLFGSGPRLYIVRTYAMEFALFD